MLNLREINVLNILWRSGKPLTSTEIVDEMQGLTQSTVIAVLRKLLKNDLVKIVGITHSGKVLSRTYQPTETSRKVLLQEFADSYERFAHMIPPAEMCKAILHTEQNPEQLRMELTKLRNGLGLFEEQEGVLGNNRGDNV